MLSANFFSVMFVCWNARCFEHAAGKQILKRRKITSALEDERFIQLNNNENFIRVEKIAWNLSEILDLKIKVYIDHK